MSIWRDEKFLRLLSPTLDRFTQKGPHIFNFRCTLCGDSETKKSKARGYIFPKGDVLLYKCHNCSIALPFAALLMRQDRRLYDEYIMERMKEETRQAAPEPNLSTAPKPTPEPLVRPVAQFGGFQPVVLSSQTEPWAPLHSVYKWAKEVRKLPYPTSGPAYDRLYATNTAYDWIVPMVGEEKAAKVMNGLPYLVIPLRLQNGEWYGAQLRMINRREYITFRWSHSPLKVFGLECWTPEKLTIVVEGPIDSLFVENSLACCSSDLLSVIHILEDADIMKPSNPRVYVYDNEPRNKEIVHQLRLAIKFRNKVVVWPKGFLYKDINDAILAGVDVNKLIESRTFQGLLAELEFQRWKVIS